MQGTQIGMRLEPEWASANSLQGSHGRDHVEDRGFIRSAFQRITAVRARLRADDARTYQRLQNLVDVAARHTNRPRDLVAGVGAPGSCANQTVARNAYSAVFCSI